MNFLNNPNFINLFHIVFVVGILVMVALNKFPENPYVDQRNFLLGLAAVVFLYHSFRYLNRQQMEGMELCPPPLAMYTMPVQRGLSDVDLTGANVHHIRMMDSDPGYSHPYLRIKQGDTVIWTNVGEVEHTVTSAKRAEWQYEKMDPSGEFDSGLMKPGDTFAVKFTQKGWFPYHCTEHEGWMQGEIVVE